MATYAAFLRGIMPTNPNMRNDKLRGVFEDLGFTHVHSVISSGNIIFDSRSKSASTLEAKIEKALEKNLGIKCTTFVRCETELTRLIKKDPFKGKIHNRKSYLIVTFLKKAPREVFTVLDLAHPDTPALMREIEKKYGKAVTTRTWKTMERIVKKINKS